MDPRPTAPRAGTFGIADWFDGFSREPDAVEAWLRAMLADAERRTAVLQLARDCFWLPAWGDDASIARRLRGRLDERRGRLLQLMRPPVALDFRLPPPVDLPTESEPDAPAPVERPTWVCLEVVHEAGGVYPGLEGTLLLPDGTSRTITLDGASRFRADDIPRGAGLRLRLPETLESRRKPADPAPATESPQVSVGPRPAVAVTLCSGADNRVVVGRPLVQVLEAEEVTFGLERAVLLPDIAGIPRHAPGPVPPTGLQVAAAALRYARDEPRKHLLVAGHTDARGSEDFNLELARTRAHNVQLFLAGDHDAWAEHCQAHAQADDVQTVLAWVDRAHHGFDCNPGTIDGDWGPLSQGALDRFRAHHAERFGSSAASEAPPSADDWKAFARLFDLEIVHLTAIPEVDLALLREQLSWCDPAFVGFGEAYARHTSKASDALRSEDRRVDVMFFDPEELPAEAGEDLGEELYGDAPRYRHELLLANRKVELDELGIRLLDEDGFPVVGARYEVHGADGKVAEGVLDAEGAAVAGRMAPGTYVVTFLGLDATAWFAPAAAPRELPPPPDVGPVEYEPELPDDDPGEMFDAGEDDD